MIKKEEVRRFINKYINYNLSDEDKIKYVETITRYVGYDKNLVSNDIEKINKFIMENFKIDAINICADKLTIRRDGSTWNELKDLYDLALLEELLGLGIVSGLIIDDYKVRINLFLKLGNDNIYMCPELLDIQAGEEEHIYMEYMRENIIPLLHFNIDSTKIKEEQKVSYNKEEKKELMNFWFNKINQMNVDEYTQNQYETLVNTNVERIVNAAVLMRLMNQGPESFYINMKIDPSCLFIEKLNQEVNKYSKEKRDYFEEVKKVFLNELSRIKNDLDNPIKGNKKTL